MIEINIEPTTSQAEKLRKSLIEIFDCDVNLYFSCGRIMYEEAKK